MSLADGQLRADFPITVARRRSLRSKVAHAAEIARVVFCVAKRLR